MSNSHILTLISVIQTKDCRTCKPGYYASRQCTAHHDTVCKPCPRGTLSTVYNVFEQCSPCSKCDVGSFVLKPCSKYRDTVCELCSAVTDITSVTDRFQIDCLQHQNDQAGVNLDISDTSGIKLHNDNVGNYGSHSVIDQTHVIYEGSGEVVREAEEEFGSGISPVIEDVDTNVTSVILPDETRNVSVTETTTPEKTGIIVIDEGIKLKNETVATITLKKGHGFDITEAVTEAKAVTTIGSVDVYIKKTHDIYDHRSPKTGASKREKDDSSGTSIGVVVTVGLVTALVFFILGFLASKFWSSRRERTFNVLEAERLNGKPPVQCSGIEYKDSDGRPKNKANIYDQIPATTKLNGNRADPEKGAVPIYTGPIIQETTQPTATTPSAVKRGEAWAGFSISRNSSSGSLVLQPQSVRPVSEIKYMDENDDTETDRLLSAEAPRSDVTNTSTAASSTSTNSDSKTVQDTEKTPMLSGGQGSENS